MTEENNNILSDAATGATDLVRHAGAATSEHVIAYTAQYNDAYTTINSIIQSFWERVPYFIIAIIVIIIFWLLSKLFKFFVQKALDNRSYTRQNLVLVLNRLGSTFIIFFGILIGLVISIPGFTPGQLISALGIGSVAIGFAFKDIFQNLLSGILILLSEPFKIGDDIIISGFEGTVEDIQIRATFIRSFDGRRIVIPNATVYTSAVTVNTAYTKRRCEFSVAIGYDDDLQKAQEIIHAVLGQNEHVLKHPEPSVNIEKMANSAVNLSVRWWVETTQTSISSSVTSIQAEVLDEFIKNNISIPTTARVV